MAGIRITEIDYKNDNVGSLVDYLQNTLSPACDQYGKEGGLRTLIHGKLDAIMSAASEVGANRIAMSAFLSIERYDNKVPVSELAGKIAASYFDVGHMVSSYEIAHSDSDEPISPTSSMSGESIVFFEE